MCILKERRIEIPQAEKTGVGRVVYLSEDAQAALHAWMNVRDSQKAFLFYAQGKRREKMTYGAARMVFVKYIEKAGLADKGYTLHRLRHTFASEMLNAGMRLECLQQLLGHTQHRGDPTLCTAYGQNAGRGILPGNVTYRKGGNPWTLPTRS